MVLKFTTISYTMEQKYAIIKENAKIYQKERKKVKGMILDELEKVLNMNRQYLSFLLRNTGKRVVLRNKGIVYIGEYSKERLSDRGRKKVYKGDIEGVLFKIWVLSGFISSKVLFSIYKIKFRHFILSQRYEGYVNRSY